MWENRKGKRLISLTKIILREGDCEWTCLSPATYLKLSLENYKLLSVCTSYLNNSLCLVFKFLKNSEVLTHFFSDVQCWLCQRRRTIFLVMTERTSKCPIAKAIFWPIQDVPLLVWNPRGGPRAETDMSVVIQCLFTSADLVSGFRNTFCFSSEDDFSNFPNIILILQMFLHLSGTAYTSV